MKVGLTFSLSINITAQSPATGTINGHEYVDLGLSVLWATCNVGASSPSDYGDYFAWGKFQTKSEYTEENSLTYGIIFYKYSYVFFDAANMNWGWRMPTKAELEELVEKCTWEMTTIVEPLWGEIDAYKVTGSNGQSIILPCAGSERYNTIGLVGCRYWSSTPCDNNSESYCLFGVGFGLPPSVFKMERYVGLSIRPVADKTE